jgi:hypothetical protein
VVIRSRKDKDLTRMYPGVAEAALRVRSTLDGLSMPPTMPRMMAAVSAPLPS